MSTRGDGVGRETLGLSNLNKNWYKPTQNLQRREASKNEEDEEETETESLPRLWCVRIPLARSRKKIKNQVKANPVYTRNG